MTQSETPPEPAGTALLQRLFPRSSKFAERVWRNRRSLARDIGLVVRNAHTIPWIVFPIRSEAGVKPEFDPKSYTSLLDYVAVLGQMLLPAERNSVSEGTICLMPPDYAWPKNINETKWFFVNGIATSPPMAILEAQELARAFRRPIHLIHTPTFGAVRDFLDSITARTLRKDGKLAKPAYGIVKNALLSYQHVVLVTYSQGTIVASYIVRKLLKDPELRDHVHKLEVYCVAGVADSLHIDYPLTAQHGRAVPYVEHFVNGRDFFARIGVLSHYYSTAGAIFVEPQKKGHMLNDHYITGIERGEYCQGRSRLYKYVGGGHPGDKDYIAFDRRR
jgi:hypothetical protein